MKLNHHVDLEMPLDDLEYLLQVGDPALLCGQDPIRQSMDSLRQAIPLRRLLGTLGAGPRLFIVSACWTLLSFALALFITGVFVDAFGAGWVSVYWPLTLILVMLTFQGDFLSSFPKNVQAYRRRLRARKICLHGIAATRALTRADSRVRLRVHGHQWWIRAENSAGENIELEINEATACYQARVYVLSHSRAARLRAHPGLQAAPARVRRIFALSEGATRRTAHLKLEGCVAGERDLASFAKLLALVFDTCSQGPEHENVHRARVDGCTASVVTIVPGAPGDHLAEAVADDGFQLRLSRPGGKRARNRSGHWRLMLLGIAPHIGYALTQVMWLFVAIELSKPSQSALFAVPLYLAPVLFGFREFLRRDLLRSSYPVDLMFRPPAFKTLVYCASHLSVPEQGGSILLGEPFQLTLTRTRSQELLGVEISQRRQRSVERIRFSVPACSSPSLEALPVYESGAPHVVAAEFVQRLWPVLALHLESQGEHLDIELRLKDC